MHYDPILCMNVPDKAKDAGYEYRVVENTGFNKSTHPYILQVKNALGWGNAGTYKTKEQAESVGKNFNKNYAMVNDDSSSKIVDKAIRACDYETIKVLKKKNGYELGVNNVNTIYLAYPGETVNNPTMYLGKDNPANRANAEQMFEIFANKKKRSSDSKSDLANAIPVGNGYVKDSGGEWIVYDVAGNIIGRYTTYDEAVKAANRL